MSPAVPRPIVSEAEFRFAPGVILQPDVFVLFGPGHQEIVGRLIVVLRLWAETRSRPVTVGHAPLDVQTDDTQTSTEVRSRQVWNRWGSQRSDF
jgi:hypothetical protein